MAQGFSYSAPLGINLDLNENNPEMKNYSKFLKNLTTQVNTNPDGSAPQIAGNNATIYTPLISTEIICDIERPAGENYCIGAYNSVLSKETYCHVWNSEGNHFNYVISEDGVTCRKVYDIGSCLNYQLKPENFIPQSRNELWFKCQTNLFTGLQGNVKNWVFTDGYSSQTEDNWQKFINVEDSIATKSFTWDPITNGVKFRYSNTVLPTDGITFDPCEYIQLIVYPPQRCVKWEELENTEPTKNNFLSNRTWQFRVKFIDVWNRQSIHGVISDLYVPATSNCQSNAIGLPRCLKLTIEAGSPIVSKIQIERRNCVNTNSDIAVETDWYIYDIINKYGDCGVNSNKDWWERIMTFDGNTYDPKTNTFEYIFCGDRECTPIPVEETNKVQEAIPITSQSLARVGNVLALGNNKVGYPGISCDVKELLSVEYEPPVATCEAKYCDIEFWAVIHNPLVNSNEPIYNVGGTEENNGFIGGRWKWGGIGLFNGLTIPNIVDTDTDYGQTFTGQTNNQRNFYAYLEGTDFKVQGYQQLFEGGILRDNGAVPLNSGGDFRQVGRKIKNGAYYLQHFVFKNVPSGKYLVRIAGHNNSTDVNYQDSSTYVVGTIDKSNYVSTGVNYNSHVDTYYKELEINTCDLTGIFSTQTMFMICDLTAPDDIFNGNSFSNVWYGYLKDSEGRPVELAPVVIDDVDLTSNANVSLLGDVADLPAMWLNLINKTDHNGFWFCAYAPTLASFSGTISFTYSVEDVPCNTIDIGFSDEVNTLAADAAEIPLTVSEDPVLGVPDYGKCRSIFIKGRITDCENKPVVGITVCFTRSKSGKTNSAGYFTIAIHNDIDTNLPTPSVLGRELGAGTLDDKIFLSQNGFCVFTSCVGCVMCIPIEYNVDINLELLCFDCDGSNKKELFVLPTAISFPFADQHGLKHGSTIKIGMKAFDAAGRHTFVGTNDSLILDIPKAQAQLSQLFGRVKYTLTNYTFPTWMEYLGLYWTDQNAYYTSLEFIISSVEYNSQTGKITLGFQSIINYNTDNNFKTNTTWEFLKGDRIEFIADETGAFYNANTLGILNFQIEGNTLNTSGIIDYDNRLANLKAGTLIQLQRPKECNSELFYYEICAPIKLTADKRIPTDSLTGYLNIWNSYLVSRRIRFGNDNLIHTFPFSFESQAPSDFWGGSCANRGRINSVNAYEQSFCEPLSVYLSDSYSTNINGISRFSDSNKHFFIDTGFGGITAIIVKLNYVLFVCSKSSFVVSYEDNTLQLDSQKRVIYNPDRFSKPSGVNQEMGCELVDVSTIQNIDGSVIFLDRNNNALVINNFSQVQDMSLGLYHGYLITKIDSVKSYNNNPQREFDKIFISGQDPNTGQYYLTQWGVPRINRNPVYFNDEDDINESIGESFSISTKDGTMRSFYTFVPEFYSTLNNRLISFKQGQAHNHGIRNTNSFNKIYGVQKNSIFDFVANCDSQGLVKFYQWINVYRQYKLWSAAKVSTESGQLSEIPISNFEEIDNFQTSEFLCDILTYADPNISELATANGRLFEGDCLKGKYIRIKLVSETLTTDEYFELQAAVIFASGVMLSGEGGGQ